MVVYIFGLMVKDYIIRAHVSISNQHILFLRASFHKTSLRYVTKGTFNVVSLTSARIKMPNNMFGILTYWLGPSTILLMAIFLFFYLKKNYWSLADLQRCDDFFYTRKWFSFTYTHIHSFADSLPISFICHKQELGPCRVLVNMKSWCIKFPSSVRSRNVGILSSLATLGVSGGKEFKGHRGGVVSSPRSLLLEAGPTGQHLP